MESNIDQDIEPKKNRLFEKFPFLFMLKSRLISYVDPETGNRYIGHVAMYYKDTGRIKIEWTNGAKSFVNLNDDAAWLFKSTGKIIKKVTVQK